MAMLNGAGRRNPVMSRWFEDELFPMMLEVESKAKRLLAHNSTPALQRGNVQSGRRRREHREEPRIGSRREVVLLRPRLDDCSPPDQPKRFHYERHHANAEAFDAYYDDCEAVEDSHDDREAIEQLQQFLQESAAHQRHMAEVRRQRKEAESQYVPDTQGPVEIPLPSEAAPQSQPHKSRFEALICLYGDSADSIVSMETNLQARFDRSVDSSRPRYWPIIPLRF